MRKSNHKLMKKMIQNLKKKIQKMISKDKKFKIILLKVEERLTSSMKHQIQLFKVYFLILDVKNLAQKLLDITHQQKMLMQQAKMIKMNMKIRKFNKEFYNRPTFYYQNQFMENKMFKPLSMMKETKNLLTFI